MPMIMTLISAATLATGVAGDAASAALEPRLSVLTGLKCSVCHVNRTGGGARTDFATVYTQTQLPIRTEGYSYRNRALNDWISMGADLRVVGTAAVTDVANGPRTSVEAEKANVYVEARLIPQVLALYVDETVGPGGASSREVFGLLEKLPLNGYAKFGKFVLPYGTRIVDDLAYIRSETGFNFRTPDQGVEVGFEPGPFSVFVALSNGAGGATEGDDEKQVTASAAWISRRVRIGGSASRNRLGSVTREVVGGFGGFNAGPLAVLGEVDRIEARDVSGETVQQLVAFGEGDLLIRRGVNAKVTYGYHDRDTSVPEDQRIRVRFGLEVFPIPLFQASGFYTVLDDIPQALGQQDRVSVELHFFF